MVLERGVTTTHSNHNRISLYQEYSSQGSNHVLAFVGLGLLLKPNERQMGDQNYRQLFLAHDPQELILVHLGLLGNFTLLECNFVEKTLLLGDVLWLINADDFVANQLGTYQFVLRLDLTNFLVEIARSLALNGLLKLLNLNQHAPNHIVNMIFDLLRRLGHVLRTLVSPRYVIRIGACGASQAVSL